MQNFSILSLRFFRILLLVSVINLTVKPSITVAESNRSPLTKTAEDIPEEILQTEIILEARSPVDGQPLSAAEYAEIQAALSPAAEDVPARLAPKLHRAVILLRARKVLGTLFPFLF